MKLHPRERLVAKANLDVVSALTKHDLTYGERLQILAIILASDAKYIIREERREKT